MNYAYTTSAHMTTNIDTQHIIQVNWVSWRHYTASTRAQCKHGRGAIDHKFTAGHGRKKPWTCHLNPLLLAPLLYENEQKAISFRLYPSDPTRGCALNSAWGATQDGRYRLAPHARHGPPPLANPGIKCIKGVLSMC